MKSSTTAHEDQGSTPPPGWATDDLTKSLDDARSNQWATFWNKGDAVRKLIAIDKLLLEVSKDWLNPESEIAALLLIRCHAAFRISTGLAMAGQLAETYPQCRAMLEYAAYAVHIYRNPRLGVVWLSRHEDTESKKKQKKAFAHREVLQTITTANRHAGKRFEELYERTIDLGGHPNERSVTGNTKMVNTLSERTMLAIMQHGDGIELDFGLKNVALCGMVSLEMLQIVFNARFEILGINAGLLELRKAL